MIELFVGCIVHYRSRGSADGHFPALCRAAIVTATMTAEDIGALVDGAALEQMPRLPLADLAVLNPSGLFFDEGVEHDPDLSPGTWHHYMTGSCGIG